MLCLEERRCSCRAFKYILEQSERTPVMADVFAEVTTKQPKEVLDELIHMGEANMRMTGDTKILDSLITAVSIVNNNNQRKKQ